MKEPNDTRGLTVPENLDDLSARMMNQFALLERNPDRYEQTRELANLAGKIIDVAKVKCFAAEQRGVEADFPILGKIGTKPIRKAHLLSSGS